MQIPTLQFILENPLGRTQEHFFIKNYPEFHQYIINNYPSDIRWLEKIYWYYHGITKYPICSCGKRLNIKSFIKGYNNFCSLKCSGNSEKTIEKLKQTNLKKYGVEWNSQSQSTKDKMKKTVLEKYGCTCSLHNEEISGKVKQTKLERYGDPTYTNPEKRMQTKLERYGDPTYTNPEKRMQTKLERYGDPTYTNPEKREKTILEKYGVKNMCESTEYQEKWQINRLKHIVENNSDILEIKKTTEGILYKCKCPHPECDKCQEKYFEILSQHRSVRNYNQVELCTKIHPIDYNSGKNTNLELFVKNILNLHDVKYKSNNRTILNGKELDIYIPSEHLAIECNGIYWHSSDFKVNSYHYNKWKECKEQGIQLLTVWEDQIIHKPSIIESIILSKLGIYDRRLGARKCEIKEVKSSECSEFLNTNHLQGSVNSKVRLGLYYNNELVSLMTFGSKRKCMGGKESQWELHRYCNKIGTQVVGGASKLFKYFIETYSPSSIESFSSNDISNGNLYKQLGFKKSTESESYWYIRNNVRYHRYRLRKSEINKMGYKNEYDTMRSMNYFKIYDCWQTKYIWSFKIK